MPILHYNNDGMLCLEDIVLADACSDIETPFYIYSANEIRHNCQQLLTVAKGYDLLPCYALKANYNPSIIKLIQQQGFGADVVSGGELQFALKCGIAPRKIVFAGVGKTKKEIEKAIQTGIHSLNIESESELNLVANIAGKLKTRVAIAIRINPDIDAETHPYISTGLHENKFGVDRKSALNMYDIVQQNPYLDAAGIHVHLGSQIQSVEPYLETAQFILSVLDELKKKDILIKFIDLGGGIGIHYDNLLDESDSERTLILEILPSLLKTLAETDCEIIVELGRAIVGSAGLLVSEVLYKKQTPQKHFVIVDAAMNNLIRPSLYQAFHQILALNNHSKMTEVVDVVGPVCETGDYLAKNRKLPVLSEGDYIAITGAGAYGQVLSSNYNLRPRIAEYLVDGSNMSQIYSGESTESLMDQFRW
jgi:diaminopimelate decarboxylase